MRSAQKFNIFVGCAGVQANMANLVRIQDYRQGTESNVDVGT